MGIDVGPKPPLAPVYLGDAVYASFDGFHIQLTLNDHRNPPMIAIEYSVYRQLERYAKEAFGC